VKASLDSPYGVISSYWHDESDQLLYDVTIPPNTSAILTLPVPPHDVRQARQPLPGGDAAVTSLTLSAGTYHFSFLRRLLK
jgi:alpha-L-rhamnosidase